MKEAFGGISLFQIVVLFLLLFTGVMCLTINHSKAFGVKDEIINAIEAGVLASYSVNENYELDNNTVNNIIENFNEVGYRISGDCPEGWNGYNRNGTKTQNDAAFCVRAVIVEEAFHKDIEEKCENGKCQTTYGDFPSMVYYDVILFYQLDIPIIKQVFDLKLYGSTKIIIG